MTISAWWLFPATIPVLYLGDFLIRRIALLRRFSIPVPVVGGLLVAVIILLLNLAGLSISTPTAISQKWWMWLSTPEVKLAGRATMNITEPLVVAFFTCIGLNASWALAKKGGLPLIWFLAISAFLCLAQNFLGVGLCKLLGENPLMGVLTGGVALTGGPGTAMGMADTFIKAGFEEAKVVGIAAATFGLVGGSLLGGPIAALLIHWKKIQTPGHAPKPVEIIPTGFDVLPPPVEGEAATVLQNKLPGETAAEKEATATAAGDGEGFGEAPSGFIGEVLALRRFGTSLLILTITLLICIKLGSWVSFGLQQIHVNGEPLAFPVYMGAMVLGILLRNVLDLLKIKFVDSDVIEAVASILLAIFLAVTMVSLNLMLLKSVAGSMLVMLICQMLLMALFATFVTYPLMGKNYDAVVLTAGQIGFGLGATSNAVATMEATTRRFGPSPKSFLIVTIVGGFLIDVVNMWVTIGFLHFLK